MIVADASPIRYLVLVEGIDLLPWIASPPDWLKVHSVNPPEPVKGLGRGELEAIALAEALGSALLIDDLRGRTVAQERAIPIIGTLGVLVFAGNERRIDLPEYLARLRATNFRADWSRFLL